VTPQPLVDQYQRHLNYLRISITDRCNLRCVYCMPRELIPKLDHAEVLRYEEILRTAAVAARMGVRKLRVTGGEPLVRRDACDLLAALTRLPGIREVSLTTNGVLLERHLDAIRAAGVRRINVSLDSLRPERYAAITGGDHFDAVWRGLEAALDHGLAPVKINVVALRGVNEDDLADFARLTLTHPFHVRFIEQMPIGQAALQVERPLLTPEIRARIAALGPLAPVASAPLDGPAERCRLPGAVGEIGFISAISHHFCARCNRLRLTARGGLRPCLLSDREEDLRAVRHKPSGHLVGAGPEAAVGGQMSAIGG